MNRHALPAAFTLGVLLTAPPARAANPTKQECVEANDAAQDFGNPANCARRAKSSPCALAASCPGIVRDDCTQRLAEVEQGDAAHRIRAKDEAGNDLVDVKVTMDGLPFAEKLDGALSKRTRRPHFFVEFTGNADIRR